MQTMYTSGTVFHGFLGQELPDWKAASALVKKIAENFRLPYYTLSPTYSVCVDHGYIPGKHFTCPCCGKEAEVYSRITGYYRPVRNWNDGKVSEFNLRRTYVVDGAHGLLRNNLKGNMTINSVIYASEHGCDNYKCNVSGGPVPRAGVENSKADRDLVDMAVANVVDRQKPAAEAHVMLFKTSTCPKCRAAEAILDNAGIKYNEVFADYDANRALVDRYSVTTAPTLVIDTGSAAKQLAGIQEITAWVKACR